MVPTGAEQLRVPGQLERSYSCQPDLTDFPERAVQFLAGAAD
jgi:hypothetical protein